MEFDHNNWQRNIQEKSKQKQILNALILNRSQIHNDCHHITGLWHFFLHRFGGSDLLPNAIREN